MRLDLLEKCVDALKTLETLSRCLTTATNLAEVIRRFFGPM